MYAFVWIWFKHIRPLQLYRAKNPCVSHSFKQAQCNHTGHYEWGSSLTRVEKMPTLAIPILSHTNYFISLNIRKSLFALTLTVFAGRWRNSLSLINDPTKLSQHWKGPHYCWQVYSLQVCVIVAAIVEKIICSWRNNMKFGVPKISHQTIICATMRDSWDKDNIWQNGRLRPKFKNDPANAARHNRWVYSFFFHSIIYTTNEQRNK